MIKKKFSTQQKLITFAIYAIIFVVLGYVFYQQLFVSSKEKIWDSIINDKDDFKLAYILIAFILIPLNWYFEWLKWQVSIQNFSNMNLVKGAKSILVGITLGLITPQRIGELGGRVLYLPVEHRWKGVASVGICGFFQFMVTFIFGVVSVLFLYPVMSKNLPNPYWLISLLIIVLIIISIGFYFQTRILNTLKSISFLQKWKPVRFAIEQLMSISPRQSRALFTYSLIRYLIYGTQYYLILLGLSAQISEMVAIPTIGSLFFVQLGIPLPPFLGLMARGEIAMVIWGIHGLSEWKALFVSLSLWTFNLAIPSLIGALFLWKDNLLNQSKV